MLGSGFNLGTCLSRRSRNSCCTIFTRAWEVSRAGSELRMFVPRPALLVLMPCKVVGGLEDGLLRNST
ncbi:predicted protein [Plenodomus lingam JN3]|uniref:Predicted protein n=1 Tax=Leptosphaeria maculans (strain JN3 / isolate v23.1.3 / race Av1-4-5-6-7-8) TaxID=985895 RepID=E4ZQN4_LEPMJ|nr:predicted protein [Plenodomus lingam JN3]CBX94039.1 predicted protein [Plenodomus lingam JN3]